MPIRLYRAYSPGTRSRSSLFFDDLAKNKAERSLTFGKKRCSGRNNRGVITLKARGGSHKRKYRVINFRRTETNSLARVVSIEYDPNRNARIARLHYLDGSKKYIISPRSLKIGATIYSGNNSPIEIGNAMALEFIPLGSIVHNIALYFSTPYITKRRGHQSPALTAVKLSFKDNRFQGICWDAFM